MVFEALAAILIGYLFGSIPIGYLYGRFRGVDVRRLGFGKIGTSNIEHLFGLGPAVLVFFLDVAKGLIPALLGKLWLGMEVGILAGLAAVLGHSFSCFLRSAHGRGVATSFGTIIPFAPWEFLIGFGVMAVMTIFQGSSPLWMFLCFLLIPPLNLIYGRPLPIILLGVALLVLLILRRGEGIKKDLRSRSSRSRLILNRLLYDTANPERKPPLWHRLRRKNDTS
jgi:glycerol-3-phosphate acyltransferase PlsY